MGFFSIDIDKWPSDHVVPIIQKEVWFPNLNNAAERSRVLNQPGLDRRLTIVREVDPDAAVFQVNRTIKGRYNKVVASRPGIVTRTDEANFEVHLPVWQRLGDIGSFAVESVELDRGFADMYEKECGANPGQLAVAKAIKVVCMYGVPESRVINQAEHK